MPIPSNPSNFSNPSSPKELGLDAQGRWPHAQWLPSPNCDDRPCGVEIDTVVIHSISLPPGSFGTRRVHDLFMNELDAQAHPYFAKIEHLRVSAHFFIERQGHVAQFVSCYQRAWHAGTSNLKGRVRVNDFSVGIELEGTEDQPFTDVQYATLAQLVNALDMRYTLRHIVGHSDIAPGRKTDPGYCFDWPRFFQNTQLSSTLRSFP